MKQRELDLPTWGGKRKGAGRKPRSGKRMAPHRARPEHMGRHPAHVTLRVVHGVPKLRSKVPYRLIKHAFAETKREDFRIVHYSVQRDHLHLIVEADDKRALSCGVRALEIRIAHRINRLCQRQGRLFADRYHAHPLKNPTEARNGLGYVLLNARKHARQRGIELPRNWIDPYSSCDYFFAWGGGVVVTPRDPFDEVVGPPVSPARTWLITRGLERARPIYLHEVPASHEPALERRGPPRSA